MSLLSGRCYRALSEAVLKDRTREACAIFGRLKRLERGLMAVLRNEEYYHAHREGGSWVETGILIVRLHRLEQDQPDILPPHHATFPSPEEGGKGHHQTIIKAMKLLRDLGLAEGSALYDYEEYRPAGYGHRLTPLGYAVADLALKAGMKVQVREETL